MKLFGTLWSKSAGGAAMRQFTNTSAKLPNGQIPLLRTVQTMRTPHPHPSHTRSGGGKHLMKEGKIQASVRINPCQNCQERYQKGGRRAESKSGLTMDSELTLGYQIRAAVGAGG